MFDGIDVWSIEMFSGKVGEETVDVMLVVETLVMVVHVDGYRMHTVQKSRGACR